VYVDVNQPEIGATLLRAQHSICLNEWWSLFNYLEYRSKVPVCLVYVHLSGLDVGDATLKANGFTSPRALTMTSRDSTVCHVDNIETLVEDKLRAMMMKLLIWIR